MFTLRPCSCNCCLQYHVPLHQACCSLSPAVPDYGLWGKTESGQCSTAGHFLSDPSSSSASLLTCTAAWGRRREQQWPGWSWWWSSPTRHQLATHIYSSFPVTMLPVLGILGSSPSLIIADVWQRKHGWLVVTVQVHLSTAVLGGSAAPADAGQHIYSWCWSTLTCINYALLHLHWNVNELLWNFQIEGPSHKNKRGVKAFWTIGYISGIGN